MSGVVVATTDKVDFLGVYTRHFNGTLGCMKCQIAGSFVFGRDMAFANAGAGDDPIVGGIHHLRQIVVGQNFFRQITAGAGDAGINHAVPSLCSRDICSLMRRNTPLRASSTARSMANWKAKLSAEPWLFTTTPFRPSKLAPL